MRFVFLRERICKKFEAPYLKINNLQYKQIIRKPNTNYDEQVKEIDNLVQRLDGEKQASFL